MKLVFMGSLFEMLMRHILRVAVGLDADGVHRRQSAKLPQ